MRPPDPGRGVGKESEYLGCGGGPSPGEPRLLGLPCSPSGVRRIFGRALNADKESATLQPVRQCNAPRPDLITTSSHHQPLVKCSNTEANVHGCCMATDTSHCKRTGCSKKATLSSHCLRLLCMEETVTPVAGR